MSSADSNYRSHHTPDLPDNAFSCLTPKDVVLRWTEIILKDVREALTKYCMQTGNIDAGDYDIVSLYFSEAFTTIRFVTPVLEDFLVRDISGIDNIVKAIYGEGSDELYMLKKFLKIADHMFFWAAPRTSTDAYLPGTEDVLWDDCQADTRLKRILQR